MCMYLKVLKRSSELFQRDLMLSLVESENAFSFEVFLLHVCPRYFTEITTSVSCLTRKMYLVGCGL